MAAIGEKPFRTKQLWHWIYHHGATDFDAMTTIAKKVRPTLKEKFSTDRPGISAKETSQDGTRKWLLRFDDGNEAECVYIPETDRGALCISSQVGCTLNCSFCRTGTQKLVRNLSASEIVGQSSANRVYGPMIAMM